MKKFDYLFVAIIILSIGVSSVSFGLVLQAEEKFENINQNVQSIKESFFTNQVGNQRYNCLQDFEIGIAKEVIINENMNKRTECMMKVDVSMKIFQYKEYGLEPSFKDSEITYLESVLRTNDVPVFDEMLQFKPVNQTEFELQQFDELINNLQTNSTE